MSVNHNVLNLVDALQHWCDPSLVQRVKDEECRCSESQLDRSGIIQLTSREVRRKPTNTSWMGGFSLNALHAAWEDLIRDFRKRVEQGEIHLRGVQLAPEQRTELERIPGVWAADFQFNLSKGTIKTGTHRYGAVSCSQGKNIVRADLGEAEPFAAASKPSAIDQASQWPISGVRPISFSLTADGRVCFDGGAVLTGACARLVQALIPNFKNSLATCRGADGHAYMTGKRLAEELGVPEASLRQQIRRLRAALKEQFDTHVHATINDDDVIQNEPGRGYRLNPRLSLTSMPL